MINGQIFPAATGVYINISHQLAGLYKRARKFLNCQLGVLLMKPY
jgi:hypothetical protein